MPIVQNTAGLNIPDVYIIEVEPPVQVLGKATGVVAFAAQFERGNLAESVIVSDPSDLIRKFGRFKAGLDGFMFALNMMKQGANVIKVVRVGDAGTTSATGHVSGAAGATALFDITANSPGTWGNEVTCAIAASTVSGYVDVEFRFGNEITTYRSMNFDSTDTVSYLIDTVNQDTNAIVTLTRVAAGGVTTLPTAQAATALTGGSNGTTTGSSLDDAYYVGTSAASGRTGNVVFEADDDVNILTATRYTSTVNAAVIAQAVDTGVSPRMAVISVPAGTSVASIRTTMQTINSDKVVMVYPWFKIYNAYTKANEIHSPVSFYAGMLSTLSPHLSPSRKQIFGTLGMERDLTRAEVGQLIDSRVSPITKLLGQGIVVRAGINTSSNGGKNQVSRRRMVNYLAIALEQGLQPFVSRPHTSQLRADVRTAINQFLERELREGRIGNSQGGKAYGVKCDAENNPPAVVQGRRMIIDVQVSLFAPADILLLNLDASEEKTNITGG